MLHITVPAQELFNEETQEFVEIKEQSLVMEHSLISISKWEAKWKKPYFSRDKQSEKTNEEVLDYLRCMTVTPQKVLPEVYRGFTKENLAEVTAYIEDPMTATTIRQLQQPSNSREVVTSEIIYYWMIAQNIPIEFEKWHINRLLTLIRVCAIKNDPNPKKMSPGAIARQNAALNKARRAKYKTRG